MYSEMRETTKEILLGLAAIDSGEIHNLPITPELYPEESLKATVEAFAAYCECGTVQTSAGPSAALSIRVRAEHRQQSREIIGGFLSYLLHHAAQIRFRQEAQR